MIRVDFYILNSGSNQLLSVLYKLVAKAYENQQTLYIHTDSQQQAQQIDEFLWTFREGDFIPHQLFDKENYSSICPIYIGAANSAPPPGNILVNLSAVIPEFYKNFSRVIELVLATEPQRSESRKKYAVYREQDCQLHTHPL